MHLQIIFLGRCTLWLYLFNSILNNKQQTKRMIYNSRIQIRRLAHFSCTNSMQLFFHRVPIFKITDNSRRGITHGIKCLFSNCNLYHFIFLEPRLICWRSSHFFTPCVGPYFQHSMLSMNEVFGFLILFLRGVKDDWFLNSEDNNLSRESSL